MHPHRAIDASNGGNNGAARQTKDWQRAFVATYPGTPVDERVYAEQAIRYARAIACFKPMSGEMALDELEKLIYDFEDICGTLPAPVWSIYRELRKDGVVVSLDGHGSDEMLGGYSCYINTALKATGGFLRRPVRALELINTFCSMYTADGPFLRPSRLRMAINDPLFRFPLRIARAGYCRTIKPLLREHGVAANPSPEVPWVKCLTMKSRFADAGEERAIDALGPVNARLYRDFHFTVLPTILRNFDRCSMAHGIEVRMPFMDWRLVCPVFSLPEKSKIGGGFTKRVLRRAMQGVMPESLRTRKGKIGFSSPLPQWFNGALRDWVREQVHENDFIQSELWNGQVIRDFVEENTRSGWDWDSSYRIWPFLRVHLWRKVFLRSNETDHSVCRTLQNT